MIPISNGREGTFLLVFLAQYFAGIGYLVFLLWRGEQEFPQAFLVLGALIVIATANSILLVEGIPMVAERYLNRRWQEGRQEGLQEGLQEGRQEGLQEGLQEGRQEGLQEGLQEGRQEGLQEGKQEGSKVQQRKWEEWNARRLQAESRGEPFTEPPPTIGRGGE